MRLPRLLWQKGAARIRPTLRKSTRKTRWNQHGNTHDRHRLIPFFGYFPKSFSTGVCFSPLHTCFACLLPLVPFHGTVPKTDIQHTINHDSLSPCCLLVVTVAEILSPKFGSRMESDTIVAGRAIDERTKKLARMVSMGR